MSMRKRSRAVRGQTLIEFALVIGIIAILAIGIAEGYFVFRAYTSASDAAEVGAETAAIFGGDVPEIQTAIESSLRGDFVTLPFTYTVTPAQARVGDPIVVRVRLTEPLRFIFGSIQLKAAQALRYSERDFGW